jgi:hypothetical protein
MRDLGSFPWLFPLRNPSSTFPVGLAARCEWGPLAVRQVGSADGGVAHASQRAGELGILAQVVVTQTKRGAGMLP